MDQVVIILVLFTLYAVPAGIVTGAMIFLGRGKVAWRRWEFCLLFPPFILWVSLALWHGYNKSLSNAEIEPLLCGILGGFPFIARLVGFRITESEKPIFSFAGVAVACLGVLAIYFGMPLLPE